MRFPSLLLGFLGPSLAGNFLHPLICRLGPSVRRRVAAAAAGTSQLSCPGCYAGDPSPSAGAA